MPGKLQELMAYVDRLEQRAPLDEVAAFLRRLQLTCTDVAEFTRFADSHYQRNLIHKSSWCHLWALCWKNGQRSPIHDHHGSNCVVQVLRGTLTETRFEFAPNGYVKAVRSDDYPADSILQSHDMDLHQVSNLAAGDLDLVTLHVYSPPLLRMGTYSLTERTRGEEIWVAGGAGI